MMLSTESSPEGLCPSADPALSPTSPTHISLTPTLKESTALNENEVGIKGQTVILLISDRDSFVAFCLQYRKKKDYILA